MPIITKTIAGRKVSLFGGNRKDDFSGIPHYAVTIHPRDTTEFGAVCWLPCVLWDEAPQTNLLEESSSRWIVRFTGGFIVIEAESALEAIEKATTQQVKDHYRILSVEKE